MHPFLRISALCALLVSSAAAKSLLLLPVSGETGRTTDMAAIDRLFRDAVENRQGGTVLAPPATAAPCGDRACALDAAKAAGADEVLYSSLSKLGERWIFSATVLNADGTGAFNQRLTALSIEDMESVTQRMADAVVGRKNLEQVASVDNITEREQAHEPERRRSLYNSGFALGYLFPVGSSFSYLSQDDYPADTQTRHSYDQMIRMTWLNTWEFRNNLALGGDITWSLPYALGADLNLRYLFSRGDFTPFVGGGLGLHYVKSDEGNLADDHKRNSGPALNVQGGVMLFRTYDINVMLRGQYQVIFNSDLDQGPAVDVGVSFRPKESRASRSDEGLGFWGYTGLSLVILMIIGAVSG